MQNGASRPQTGDIVIWDMEPDPVTSIYWLRTHGRGGATQVFEGPDAWTRARSAAEQLVGPDRFIWRRHKDGRVERLIDANP